MSKPVLPFDAYVDLIRYELPWLSAEQFRASIRSLVEMFSNSPVPPDAVAV